MARQLRDLVTVLLLPAFFAFAGMRTRIDLLAGTEAWLICGVIVAVATVGKFGGTFAGGPVDRLLEPGQLDARNPDEHSRSDGAHRAQHRSRARRDLANALRHDGADGDRHDDDDVADPGMAGSGSDRGQTGVRRGFRGFRRFRGAEVRSTDAVRGTHGTPEPRTWEPRNSRPEIKPLRSATPLFVPQRPHRIDP